MSSVARRAARSISSSSVELAVGLGAQQRRVARDDREQVVEVVRDAAGEAPDRLHAPRLLELLLEAALLGDVADDERRRVDVPVRVADREAGDGRRERRAVAAAPALRLVLERVARGDPAHELGVPALPPLLDEHVAPRPADRLLVGPAEHPRGRRVPGDDRPVEPEADDRVARGVDDRREPALLLLRLALLGDVARDRRDPGDLALVVLDRADRVREDELAGPRRRVARPRRRASRPNPHGGRCRPAGRAGTRPRPPRRGPTYRSSPRLNPNISAAAVLKSVIRPSRSMATTASLVDRTMAARRVRSGVRPQRLGHVARRRRDADRATVLVADGCHRERHLHARAVPAQPLGQHALHGLVGERAPQQDALLLGALGRDDDASTPAGRSPPPRCARTAARPPGSSR